MINILWVLFIVIGITYGLVTGQSDKINAEILNSAKTSLDMVLNMLPLVSLWVGIMKIASSSGLLEKLSNFLSPLLSFYFQTFQNHESLGLISSNMIANLFGLGNAFTFWYKSNEVPSNIKR